MKERTWKRQVAGLCLLGVFILAFAGMIEALAILAPLTFIFATAAFGMDWASKQTDLVNKPLKPEDSE